MRFSFPEVNIWNFLFAAVRLRFFSGSLPEKANRRARETSDRRKDRPEQDRPGELAHWFVETNHE
jgi:hypothetical protein